LLAGELIMVLGGPQLCVNLPSTNLHLLLLLVGLVVVREEIHTWLWYGGPHHDLWDSQEHRGALHR
jgi:hypothetical protein